MVYGAQLIYLIRQFLTDEEIIYHMATKDNNGKYQASAFISQEEILKNLSVTVKNKAIGVSKILQNDLIKQSQINFQIDRRNQWNRVNYLGEGRYISGKNINKIDMRKPGAKDPHWAYQNQKKDMMIYIKFNGKSFQKYYDLDGNGHKDSLQLFNDGWLWEWYNSILYGGTDEENLVVEEFLKRGSIRPIIKSIDYIAGTKQGDFQTIFGNQIQSKYNNIKIISFNNIRHVIYDLSIALQKYIQNSSDQKVQNELMSILNEHFLPESVNIGLQVFENQKQELINKLKINSIK